MTDKWEVMRHAGDRTSSTVVSTHKSAELAHAAFTKALGEGHYALDVCYLQGGHRLSFEPLYGVANGFSYYVHDHQYVWSEEAWNE